MAADRNVIAGAPENGVVVVRALPAGYEQTRQSLQLVATHILARARFSVAARFGLRVTWDGIGTPAFGARSEVLRMSSTCLVREWQAEDGTHSSTISMAGTTLAALAEFAGTDLTQPFSAGENAPPVGDPSKVIAIEDEAAAALLAWYRLGAMSLDRVLSRMVGPSVLQLWPEHFDIALDARTSVGRVNFGASPGDAALGQPYLYVGPWESDRPGDAAYWNAAFGAVLTHADVVAAPDPVDATTSFLEEGLDLLG